ncbi:putative membrane protein [Xanthomonas bromi]|uniref:Putative membrane protein n=1 Tax=Xanthomonas bromi TaxID=56449 RepID=A0A1C3NIL1_9XANT|nr:hypothetical protein [Xanthomonas bromi]PPV08056.1 hypothetical protein XbrCFBP1976_05025 [Xanthomonas bromi]SBV50252.1 putative membrane protein [Xanthomonas bromi]
MNDDAHDALVQIALAAGRLETVIASLQQQTQAAQAQMQAPGSREQEEAKFRQAMVALFQAQQQRMESALLPRIAWAWKIIATLAMCLVLLLAGFFLLLNQANDQLHAARARAAAADVRADVQEAAKHVDITSCGGRPCIKLDTSTPTWKSQGSDYILVDAPSNHPTRKRP